MAGICYEGKALSDAEAKAYAELPDLPTLHATLVHVSSLAIQSGTCNLCSCPVSVAPAPVSLFARTRVPFLHCVSRVLCNFFLCVMR